MTVTVHFACGGCDATTEGTTWLQRRFVGLYGNTHGWGRYVTDTPQDVAPDGWVAFDPYTGACYCPACWESIESGIDEAISEPKR